MLSECMALIASCAFCALTTDLLTASNASSASLEDLQGVDLTHLLSSAPKNSNMTDALQRLFFGTAGPLTVSRTSSPILARLEG